MSTGALIDLLGDSRAAIVDALRQGPRQVGELAQLLGVTPQAVRRHVTSLEAEGFITSQTVRRAGPGRPASAYELTARGRSLYPDRSKELAAEALSWIEQAHGREALQAFLRWRVERHGSRYAEALADAGEGVEARATRLAQLLSEDGFLAEVDVMTAADGRQVLQLRQGHCAIADVAREHPELCAHEAGLFRRLLGTKVSRRQTIAGGATSCVCTVDAAPAVS